jgi:hypothetical protein
MLIITILRNVNDAQFVTGDQHSNGPVIMTTTISHSFSDGGSVSVYKFAVINANFQPAKNAG